MMTPWGSEETEKSTHSFTRNSQRKVQLCTMICVQHNKIDIFNSKNWNSMFLIKYTVLITVYIQNCNFVSKIQVLNLIIYLYFKILIISILATFTIIITDCLIVLPGICCGWICSESSVLKISFRERGD